MTAVADTSTFQPAARRSGRAALWTGRILSGLIIAFLVFDSGIKLVRLPIVDETGGQLGLPPGAGFALGVLLAWITVLYAIPRTAVIGAVLLTGYLGGAICTHVIAGSPLFTHVLFGVYLGVIAWAGLWLRDPALRALFPVRR
ncbi:DoxX family protein [Phenylobacterium terrae]|uniref:DoxX family protein n=1 Tax=Phenylobacterium terrae TaxID=2665495 RepID=A0ABW4MZZ0_9CAUL